MTTSERDAVRELAEELAKAARLSAKHNVPIFDRVLRESHLPELVTAMQKLTTFPAKECDHQGDDCPVCEGRRALAAFLKGAE
jgi:hypothetical protein